ncbi:unnamed protein product, partial [Brenthis ino]
MDESGIDMGYDLASLLTNDFNIDQRILDEMTTGQDQQDFMFYELKSKAVPVTESRNVRDPENNLAKPPVLLCLCPFCELHLTFFGGAIVNFAFLLLFIQTS